jgi:signal transduction histidine kinase
MESMEEALPRNKQDDSPSSLRVSTQSRRRPRGAVERRVRAAALPLCCVLFMASAAIALALPADPSALAGGVVVDAATTKVVSVDPASAAWGMGVRPGWLKVATVDGITSYSDGLETRLIADHDLTPEAHTKVAVPFAVFALAGLLLVAKQRRTALTVAVGSAVIASWIWMSHMGVLGQAMAVLPVGLSGAMAWQFGVQLDMWPARPERPSVRTAVAVIAVVAVSAAGIAATTWLWAPFEGVVVGALFYAVIAWLVVLWWRVATVTSGSESLSRLAVARAVAFDMLPYSDRVRRRGAQAERDRLASDLHAEVLPAIATAAAALDQKGDSVEAERLRDLAASVRDLVSQRRLPILGDHGLVAAAEWLAESLQDRSSLTIEINLGGDNGARRPPAVESAAYRVLQLALDNVIRHAAASVARVNIAGDARSLELTASALMPKHPAGRSARATWGSRTCALRPTPSTLRLISVRGRRAARLWS